MHTLVVTVETWFIARNADSSIIHTGVIGAHQEASTGLEFLETFTDEDAFLQRLAELKQISVDAARELYQPSGVAAPAPEAEPSTPVNTPTSTPTPTPTP
jgi:hypothetical protein